MHHTFVHIITPANIDELIAAARWSEIRRPVIRMTEYRKLRAAKLVSHLYGRGPRRYASEYLPKTPRVWHYEGHNCAPQTAVKLSLRGTHFRRRDFGLENRSLARTKAAARRAARRSFRQLLTIADPDGDFDFRSARGIDAWMIS